MFQIMKKQKQIYIHKYLLDPCEHLFESAYSFLNILEVTDTRVPVIIDSLSYLDKLI
jgi:hypothetical protein